eukprot:TRINITY_DN1032_c0_g2_i1.p1 TRINITY_DN1032_c0_g2~~TRINITY_DN1032_c0_g2_i1.p1  ORF type:complete len:137 (-),score=2.26 TRINITY_DN1032_c0_g2_i1:249-659(-)
MRVMMCRYKGGGGQEDIKKVSLRLQLAKVVYINKILLHQQSSYSIVHFYLKQLRKQDILNHNFNSYIFQYFFRKSSELAVGIGVRSQLIDCQKAEQFKCVKARQLKKKKANDFQGVDVTALQNFVYIYKVVILTQG